MGSVVACPVCAVPVAWGPMSRHRPFCSERCRLIDLGAWANEGYRVPAAEDLDPAGDPGRMEQ
ncbi:MAG: DNA gyrase inhibitor YacG [Burkholderiales bacterium]